jgi:transposase
MPAAPACPHPAVCRFPTDLTVAVDTCGLLLEILITPASVQDRDGGRRLLWRLRHDLPTIRLVWADAGYAGKLVTWAAQSSP